MKKAKKVSILKTRPAPKPKRDVESVVASVCDAMQRLKPGQAFECASPHYAIVAKYILKKNFRCYTGADGKMYCTLDL